MLCPVCHGVLDWKPGGFIYVTREELLTMKPCGCNCQCSCKPVQAYEDSRGGLHKTLEACKSANLQIKLDQSYELARNSEGYYSSYTYEKNWKQIRDILNSIQE